MSTGSPDEEHETPWQLYASASDQGRVYQARGDQHVTVHVYGKDLESKPVPYWRIALTPFLRLLQVGLVFVVLLCGTLAIFTLFRGIIGHELLWLLGITIGSLVLLIASVRITTGRWPRSERRRR